MPFKQGQSGNPKGAPKKEQTFAKALNDAVSKIEMQKTTKSGEKKTIKGKKVVAEAYMDLAFNNKYPPAIRLKALDTIIERIDGKAQENISLTGEVKQKAVSIKQSLDSLSPEERDLYIELCEKMNDVTDSE